MKYALSIAALAFLSATASDLEKELTPPSMTIQRTEKVAVKSRENMVVAANPLAAQAGMKMLCQGGNALDAAIATELVLNVVEPVASGIGGGGFLLYYDKKNDKIIAFDGRETAPKSVTERLFLNEKGEPLDLLEAANGGKSVGVPGLLRMFEMAHKEFGKLPWRDLFQPAIEIAENGFTVSKVFQSEVEAYPRLKSFHESRDYFYTKEGHPVLEGTKLKSPILAQTLRLIAEKGVNVFYEGEIAEDIAKAVNRSPVQPGWLTIGDLSSYKAIRREPLKIQYRDYFVYSFPPPSSGGVAVLQILGMLNRFDLTKFAPQSTELVHLFSEASSLAFADRNKYIGDPAFVRVPISEMLDPAYLKKRSELIKLDSSIENIQPGIFSTPLVALCPECQSREPPSTSHVSIVDKEGNAVSMTCTIEHSFGSGIMVRGFLLNNELTDFSFTPEDEGLKVANRVQPDKRPRSAMAPTFVFDAKTNKLKLVIGSPGGARIIDYVARPIIDILDYKKDVQAAISAGNFVDIGGPVELEENTDIAKLKIPLEKLGQKVEVVNLNSGIHAIEVTTEGLIGGADPRKEGAVADDSGCRSSKEL